ncbi:ATPase H(+)-transporting accessory protein 2 [Pseudolycoriella hygida]|uniref:ATPase H(+)-transporting accessory protein 2 n=1 Tax=Pseudolycoriella hygida TaxID=35572 RepID=A0A9Q0MUQ8_9DIPT|nr:ATPase H(+)-transporting accessory protein 2 [Pseudolycoriella hygida]
MLKTFLIISTLFVATLASSHLQILQSPKSLSFKGNDRLDSESLADVLAASLGFSVTHPCDWKGLYINDPFSPAKGVVAIVVDGVNEFDHLNSAKTNSYELIGTGAQESLDSLVFRVQEHNAEAIDLDLTQGFDVLDQYASQLGDIKPHIDKIVSSLKPSNVEDKLFLQQISTIQALTDNIKTLDNLPKFITIRLSLTPLISAHTLASPAVTDALKLLSNAVQDLTEATVKAYNNNAVVAVVTVVEDAFSRNKRATGSGRQSDPIPPNLNLALSYSEDYPVIFNIILWFSVVLTFSLLAISYTIGYMDPGRDSIIYRMTSTRMKKDN